jgi:hypothetical protein
MERSSAGNARKLDTINENAHRTMWKRKVMMSNIYDWIRMTRVEFEMLGHMFELVDSNSVA